MARFQRDYRLLVGKEGGAGLEITPPIHIIFEVSKDTKEEPNATKIKLWNLAKATRTALEQPDTVVRLYAGYAEEDGPLLMAYGNVLEAWSYVDGPDVITELEVLDGFVEIRDTAVSLGYGPGVKASQVLKDLAGQMGLRLNAAPDLMDRTWQAGFSFYGAARAALHKIVAGTGLEWSVQNGELQIINRQGLTARQAYVLAPDSGLIGYPQRMRKGAREKARVKDQKSGDNKDIVSAKQQIDGWKVKSLLLPTLNPGDLVKLESMTVQGFFRVESLRHTGDWGGGGEWVTELELVNPATPTEAQKKKKDAK